MGAKHTQLFDVFVCQVLQIAWRNVRAGDPSDIRGALMQAVPAVPLQPLRQHAGLLALARCILAISTQTMTQTQR